MFNHPLTRAGRSSEQERKIRAVQIRYPEFKSHLQENANHVVRGGLWGRPKNAGTSSRPKKKKELSGVERGRIKYLSPPGKRKARQVIKQDERGERARRENSRELTTRGVVAGDGRVVTESGIGEKKKSLHGNPEADSS